jgi:hypothetical protein
MSRSRAAAQPIRQAARDRERHAAGEATYATLIDPDEEIRLGSGKRFRVLDVLPFEEEDASPFVGLLRVEPVR